MKCMIRGNVSSGKCHSGNCQSGKCPFGELYAWGTVLRRTIHRELVWEKSVGELPIRRNLQSEEIYCLLLLLHFLIFSPISFIHNPYSSSDWTIFIIYSISSFETINGVVPEISSWITTLLLVLMLLNLMESGHFKQMMWVHVSLMVDQLSLMV